MSYTEVLETTGDYRVKMVADEYADEPYDDGQSPLLRLDGGNRSMRWQAQHVMTGSRPVNMDGYVEAAAERWGTDFRLLEKYLRAYHGVTRMETWWSGSYWYITYDPAWWREHVGAPEGSADMSEYRAWCEGDVWGYVIEKRVTWHTDDDYDDRDTWETVDSCSGFYGSEYAEQEARGEFALMLRDTGASEASAHGE